MEEFDKDDDGKLSTTELTALLTSWRDRRSGGGPGAGGPRPDGPKAGGQRKGRGQRPDGAKKGGQRGPKGSEGTPGGQKPKRPDTLS